MTPKEVQSLRNAFDSILRADYITLDQIEELDKLEHYFVDFFGIMQSLLQKQDNFIAGRRGTGKTTNLLRAYFECLKTIPARQFFHLISFVNLPSDTKPALRVWCRRHSTSASTRCLRLSDAPIKLIL